MPLVYIQAPNRCSKYFMLVPGVESFTIYPNYDWSHFPRIFTKHLKQEGISLEFQTTYLLTAQAS